MTELPPLDRLVTARESLHRVAEHVLAAALKRATGQFTLRPVPGGVGTPPLPDKGAVLAVVGTDIVVDTGGDVRRQRLSTVREAAAFAGVEPGFPWTKNPPATPFEPDAPLTVDEASATLIADWYALGDLALMRLSAELADDDPSPAHLYPEHFDLGIAAAHVNYGFSPGDETSPLPYVYVGPWSGAPTRDEFWNADFGAYRTIEDIESVDAAFGFLREGRQRLS